MKITELFRLVWLNLAQNKSKVILTSIGIVVGAATIMLVLAIGQGGRMEVAEQFKNLNAGAVDITSAASTEQNQPGGPMENQGGPGRGGGMPDISMGGGFSGFSGGMPGMGMGSAERNQATGLTQEDLEELEAFLPDISDATISYTIKADVEGQNLDSAVSYTIAGVTENYAQISNLNLVIGEFISESNEENKEKVCILGMNAATEIFGSAAEAYDETAYIDGRPYTVTGVLEEMGTVASGISPDEAVFIPYETGLKYLAGAETNPTITVIAADIGQIDRVKENIETILADLHPNTNYSISDAGSKMEAAEKSNETLTLLLAAMAVIVFTVGGIGIMNVLFVSVKERTNEIGILKAIGCSRKDILLEFLLEASCMSLAGSVIGVLTAIAITPVIEQFSVRVELSFTGALLSLFFGVITGSLFGFYPAYKASTLVPVEALNQE